MRLKNTWVTFTKRGMRVISSLGLACAALCASPSSHAQDSEICFLNPVSVPGLSGLPNWSDPSLGTVRTDLFEPRWGNAPIRAFANDATGTEAQFRALVEGNTLAVSIQVLTEPGSDPNFRRVFFGFSSGATARVVAIDAAAGASDPNPVPAAAIQGVTQAGTGLAWAFDPPGATPAWVSAPYSWTHPSDGSFVWAVNFRVSLAGVPDGDFKVAFGAYASAVGAGAVVPYYWPTQPTPIPDRIPGTPIPQDVSLWGDAAALGAGCTEGVSITGFDIRLDNGPGTTENEILTGAGVSNKFVAEPKGLPAPVVAGMILGRFRIAHWGSTIADPTAPWTDIPNAGAVPNGADGAPVGALWHECTNGSSTDPCPVLAEGESRHQCLMVELKAAPGRSIPFARSSAYRNMNFQTLSKVSARAKIDPRGLSARHRASARPDMYVYVKESNLPEHLDKPVWLKGSAMRKARRQAETAETSPVPRFVKKGRVPPRRTKAQLAELKRRRQPIAYVANRIVPTEKDHVQSLRLFKSSPRPVLSDYQAVVSVYPTYEVHVYVDTGRSEKIGNRTVRELEPLVPFGYFFEHDGPLYGFVRKLTADQGMKLERVSRNLYRLSAISPEKPMGFAVEVSAEEAPRPAAPPKRIVPQKQPRSGASPRIGTVRQRLTSSEPSAPPQVAPGRCNCEVPGGARGSLQDWGIGAGVALGFAAYRRRRRARAAAA